MNNTIFACRDLPSPVEVHILDVSTARGVFLHERIRGLLKSLHSHFRMSVNPQRNWLA